MRRLLTALALLALGTAHAGTVYTSLSAWQLAVSGPVQTQDFSGYPAGTDLTGTAVLPGVTLSSNAGAVQVWVGATQPRAATFGNAAPGTTYYDVTYALPYLAVALDILDFESDPNHPLSTAIDQGLLTFFFSDGSSQNLAVSGGDGSAIFIGMVSDVAITSVRFYEAHEGSGNNEESSLDNLRVAMPGAVNELPLPGTLPLAMLALLAVPLARRRR